MAQSLDMHVKMTDNSMAALGYPSGSVYRCSSPVAYYLVRGKNANCSDKDGNLITCGFSQITQTLEFDSGFSSAFA